MDDDLGTLTNNTEIIVPHSLLGGFAQFRINYQFILYEKVREFERIRERMAAMKMKSGKRKEKPTSLMRIYSRMFSNFVFPKQIPRPFPSGNILEMDKNNKKDKEKVEKLIKQEESFSENRVEMAAKYKKKIVKTLNELDRRKDEFMKLKELNTYSPKMKRIIENINKSPGLVLVYSQFITLEGLGILGIALKANGYDDFSNRFMACSNGDSKCRIWLSIINDIDRNQIIDLGWGKDGDNGNFFCNSPDILFNALIKPNRILKCFDEDYSPNGMTAINKSYFEVYLFLILDYLKFY